MLEPDITAIFCTDKQVWFAVFRDPSASVGVSFRLQKTNTLSARRTRRELEQARPIFCRHPRSAPSTARPRLSIPLGRRRKKWMMTSGSLRKSP